MSALGIRQLLKEHAADDVISLQELQALLRAADDEGGLSMAERFTLTEVLEVHKRRFTPEAFQALKDYLAKR